MLRFLGNLLTSVLGVFISLFILFLILIGIVASQSTKPTTFVRSNTVLTITLSGSLPERVIDDPFQDLLEPESPKISTEMIRSNLKKAASDDRIKGIILELKSISASWATLQEVHRNLLKFKESGKFIYAYTDDMGMDEAAYYVATAADKIMSPPASFFEFDGFYVQGEFYKNLFDKVGVKPEITRYGKYKSAIEPYIRTSFSNESREQLNAILSNNMDEFLGAISESRNIPTSTLNNFLDDAPDMNVQKAFERKLIDSLVYPNEFEHIIKEKLELKSSSKLNKVKLKSYNFASVKSESATSDGKVAVIFAEGIIVPQAPNQFDKTGYLTFTDLEKAIDKAMDDKSVKAVVLRINSPGGSGTTADLMWNKLKSIKEKVPLIASMGSVAASGGYYIAVAADTIFAESTTITGSIGVFSTKFNMETLAEDKIGITFDEVKTHNHADWINPFRSFTKEEDGAFQNMVNQFYETFLDRCDEGRLLNRDQIHAIAQGRVWSGKDAQENGLVDVIGGLEDAIAFAAKKGGLDSYDIVNYPKPKSLFEQFMSGSNQTLLKMTGLNSTKLPLAYLEMMEVWQNKYRKPAIHALLPLEITIR